MHGKWGIDMKFQSHPPSSHLQLPVGLRPARFLCKKRGFLPYKKNPGTSQTLSSTLKHDMDFTEVQLTEFPRHLLRK